MNSNIFSNPSSGNIQNGGISSNNSQNQQQNRASTTSLSRINQKNPSARSSNVSRQKSIIVKIQESLTNYKTTNLPNSSQNQNLQVPMKRLQSNAHVNIFEQKRPIEAVAKQKKRENEVQMEQETIDYLKEDYRYVMSFIMNQIEYMRTQVVQNGLTEEINMIFPTPEQMEKNWQTQHPAELCYVLQDYVRFFVKMNQKFIQTKQEQLLNVDQRDEKQMILHSLELEKLQFGKKENEYQFLLEQLQKRKEELDNKLQFMEKHCTEAITFLTNDNKQLVHLVKDKDEVMDKIQEQIEIKNEHIRSQDQKLLSVLIYEFKLRKVDIKYQAQILKIMKQHSTDLEKYYSMLESCWSGLNKGGNTDVEDQFNYLKAYVQGIKNDLFNQIINIQSKYEKYSDEFNDKKKNFNQLNEVQDKIKENQLFQNESEIEKKTQSKFSKINYAQQIQNNIILNQNVSKKHKKNIRSIKDVQFMLNDQEDTMQQSSKYYSQTNLPTPQIINAFNGSLQTNNFSKPSSSNEIKIFHQPKTTNIPNYSNNQQNGSNNHNNNNHNNADQDDFYALNSPPKSSIPISAKQKSQSFQQQFFSTSKGQNSLVRSTMNFNTTASSSTHALNLNKEKISSNEQSMRKSAYQTRNNSTLQGFGSQQSIKNVSGFIIQPRSSFLF